MLLCAVGFAALTLLLVIFFLVIQSWVLYGASSSGHYNSDDYTTSVEYRNHVAHIEDTRDYCLVHGMTYLIALMDMRISEQFAKGVSTLSLLVYIVQQMGICL